MSADPKLLNQRMKAQLVGPNDKLFHVTGYADTPAALRSSAIRIEEPCPSVDYLTQNNLATSGLLSIFGIYVHLTSRLILVRLTDKCSYAIRKSSFDFQDVITRSARNTLWLTNSLEPNKHFVTDVKDNNNFEANVEVISGSGDEDSNRSEITHNDININDENAAPDNSQIQEDATRLIDSQRETQSQDPSQNEFTEIIDDKDSNEDSTMDADNLTKPLVWEELFSDLFLQEKKHDLVIPREISMDNNIATINEPIPFLPIFIGYRTELNQMVPIDFSKPYKHLLKKELFNLILFQKIYTNLSTKTAEINAFRNSHTSAITDCITDYFKSGALLDIAEFVIKWFEENYTESYNVDRESSQGADEEIQGDTEQRNREGEVEKRTEEDPEKEITEKETEQEGIEKEVPEMEPRKDIVEEEAEQYNVQEEPARVVEDEHEDNEKEKQEENVVETEVQNVKQGHEERRKSKQFIPQHETVVETRNKEQNEVPSSYQKDYSPVEQARTKKHKIKNVQPVDDLALFYQDIPEFGETSIHEDVLEIEEESDELHKDHNDSLDMDTQQQQNELDNFYRMFSKVTNERPAKSSDKTVPGPANVSINTTNDVTKVKEEEHDDDNDSDLEFLYTSLPTTTYKSKEEDVTKSPSPEAKFKHTRVNPWYDETSSVPVVKSPFDFPTEEQTSRLPSSPSQRLPKMATSINPADTPSPKPSSNRSNKKRTALSTPQSSKTPFANVSHSTFETPPSNPHKKRKLNITEEGTSSKQTTTTPRRKSGRADSGNTKGTPHSKDSRKKLGEAKSTANASHRDDTSASEDDNPNAVGMPGSFRNVLKSFRGWFSET